MHELAPRGSFPRLTRWHAIIVLAQGQLPCAVVPEMVRQGDRFWRSPYTVYRFPHYVAAVVRCSQFNSIPKDVVATRTKDRAYSGWHLYCGKVSKDTAKSSPNQFGNSTPIDCEPRRIRKCSRCHQSAWSAKTGTSTDQPIPPERVPYRSSAPAASGRPHPESPSRPSLDKRLSQIRISRFSQQTGQSINPVGSAPRAALGSARACRPSSWPRRGAPEAPGSSGCRSRLRAGGWQNYDACNGTWRAWRRAHPT
jgi:hypothetical protein